MPRKSRKRSSGKISKKLETESEEDIEIQNYKRLKQDKKKPRVFKLSSSDSEDDNCTKTEKKRADQLTVEEIKAQWKKHDEFMAKNRDLLQLANEFEKSLKEDDEKEREYQRKQKEEQEKAKNFVMKDCKHLSEKELTKLFNKDFKWINNTFRGKRYCERHEMFKTDNPKNRFTAKDLMYNVSCEVFTDEQLIHIVSLFRKKYDKGNLWKNSDYYWKVLLPEYCLKIFMDCYKLKHDEAMKYLNSIPVPVERYFKIKPN